MKNLGFGQNYHYAHDFPESYVAGENYFPDNMPAVTFYQPTTHGLENKILEKLTHLRELDKQAKNLNNN